MPHNREALDRCSCSNLCPHAVRCLGGHANYPTRHWYMCEICTPRERVPLDRPPVEFTSLAARAEGWTAGVRWAAAESDAQAAGREPVWILDITDHLRACASQPDRRSAAPRTEAPKDAAVDNPTAGGVLMDDTIQPGGCPPSCLADTLAALGVGKEAFAILVVHELNVLQQQAQDPDLPHACCPDCCAPCGVLREVLNEGSLPEVISWAPAHLGESWTPLDETALRAMWGCNSNPPCDALDATAPS